MTCAHEGADVLCHVVTGLIDVVITHIKVATLLIKAVTMLMRVVTVLTELTHVVNDHDVLINVETHAHPCGAQYRKCGDRCDTWKLCCVH